MIKYFCRKWKRRVYGMLVLMKLEDLEVFVIVVDIGSFFGVVNLFE